MTKGMWLRHMPFVNYQQTIEARFADDPWIAMGIRRIAKVERWRILLEYRK
ncbi:MAG TPA: hypothetical protein VKX46_22480 [Ktedonobacteraceae bacterium]|nr:hypothetical protein [Ktedonobacteraceae bacterium]